MRPELGPIGAITAVAGTTFCISGHTGQIRRGSEQGLYVRDTRVLSHLAIRLGGAEPLVLSGHTVGGNAARFTACRPNRPPDEPDPRVLLDRRRVVSATLVESFRLHNLGTAPIACEVTIEADTDFAYIFDVKHARATRSARCEDTGGELRFSRGEQATIVRPRRFPDDLDERGGLLTWHVDLAPRAEWVLDLEVGFIDHGSVAWPTAIWRDVGTTPVGPEPAWRTPEVRCTDPTLGDLVAQSITDLGSLLLDDPVAPGDRMFAAGSPWYLTLFGRDSLWSAYMALPLGLDVARGTLRALARRQGRRYEPTTEEAPGKIIHEVRHGGLTGRGELPPDYYGSMDATPLFVILAHEAWRWGLADGEVAELLPAVEAALGWIATDGDSDGDGFLEYQRTAAQGLDNQGWKDSIDGVQFADGRLADPPIALCEVQGYAYDAARRGAALLEHFGRPGGARWRQWADELRRRFRSAFWVDDRLDPYPAIALDGAKRRVDSATSNMGHLLATGILDTDECALVAQHLDRPDLASGWGLRTLSSSSPRFNPLSYHGGSVWPHDTAIAVAGLARTGAHEQAGALLRALVAAAPHFALRLPELFAGEQRRPGLQPLAYPAACRPQAWAAGAALLLLRAALGLEPDVPNRRLVLRPMWPPPFGRLEVRDLTLADGSLGITVDREDGVTVTDVPDGIDVTVEGAPTVAPAVPSAPPGATSGLRGAR